MCFKCAMTCCAVQLFKCFRRPTAPHCLFVVRHAHVYFDVFAPRIPGRADARSAAWRKDVDPRIAVFVGPHKHWDSCGCLPTSTRSNECPGTLTRRKRRGGLGTFKHHFLRAFENLIQARIAFSCKHGHSPSLVSHIGSVTSAVIPHSDPMIQWLRMHTFGTNPHSRRSCGGSHLASWASRTCTPWSRWC